VADEHSRHRAGDRLSHRRKRAGLSSFSGSREFSAYLGLTPRQNSSGGKERLGRVSKMGNRYLRRLLVVGAHAVLYNRKGHADALRTWASKLMETKPFKLVRANKPET
jgi:transposase